MCWCWSFEVSKECALGNDAIAIISVDIEFNPIVILGYRMVLYLAEKAYYTYGILSMIMKIDLIQISDIDI